jgi:hypothetical protein
MFRAVLLRRAPILLGILVGGIALLTMSQGGPPSVGATSTPKIEVVPHPRQMIRIREGTPFSVPAGKVLVLTALGTTVGGGSGDSVQYMVDGHQEGQTSAWRNSTIAPSSMTELPEGRSVQAGSTVAIHSTLGGNEGRLWGYLTDVGTIPVGAGNIVRVPYRPHPRDLVQVAEGQNYTVPSGMIFVLTAFGGTNGGQPSGEFDHALRVDGTLELTTLDPNSFLLPPLASVPAGFMVAAGSTIEVAQITGSVSPARAWGYLARQ